MINSNVTATPLPENHLSVEEMYQYLEGHLAPGTRHNIELHLVDCPFCSEALEGLATTSSSQTTHVLFDLNRQVKNRTQRRQKNKTFDFIKDWGLATAILLLLLVIAIMGWYQAKISSQQKPVSTSKTQAINQAAGPVGGLAAVQTYFDATFPKTPEADDSKIEIPVQVQVNPDSTLSNIIVLIKLENGLAQDIAQHLQKGPKWKPARQNGKQVSSTQKITLSLPIKVKN